MNKKDLRRCKKEILRFLMEDIDKPFNQAIFIKHNGHQVFNDTTLEMVMEKVVKGLYAAYDAEEKDNG